MCFVTSCTYLWYVAGPYASLPRCVSAFVSRIVHFVHMLCLHCCSVFYAPIETLCMAQNKSYWSKQCAGRQKQTLCSEWSTLVHQVVVSLPHQFRTPPEPPNAHKVQNEYHGGANKFMLCILYISYSSIAHCTLPLHCSQTEWASSLPLECKGARKKCRFANWDFAG